MLHCRPKCEYFTDDEGKQHFRRVRIKIWDDREYFDPAAIRRQEEYEDIDEALARLDEFSDEPSFDTVSRHRLSMLAGWLREYKRDGVLRVPERRPGQPTKDDLQAILERSLDRVFGGLGTSSR